MAEMTFLKSKLDWEELRTNVAALALHRDLLQLRCEDRTFSRQDAANLFGAVIGPEALVLRWLYNNSADRLLLINLGRELNWKPAAEPLIAPPTAFDWALCWSSEDLKYGGSGTPPMGGMEWTVPAHAAVVLQPTTIR
jgi:maltooligosyltrehalose trehalohydrolase